MRSSREGSWEESQWILGRRGKPPCSVARVRGGPRLPESTESPAPSEGLALHTCLCHDEYLYDVPDDFGSESPTKESRSPSKAELDARSPSKRVLLESRLPTKSELEWREAELESELESRLPTRSALE